MPIFDARYRAQDGSLLDEKIDCADEGAARVIARRRCLQTGWTLVYCHSGGAPPDDHVTKHLTPEGVEYRDVEGVVVASLRRFGRFEVVEPVGSTQLPRLAFKSTKAADAYAWVINLERITQ